MSTTALLLSSGASVAIKGTPEEAAVKIKAGRKPETNYDTNLNNNTIACTWEEPRWVLFEDAIERREIRVRPDRIDAIVETTP